MSVTSSRIIFTRESAITSSVSRKEISGKGTSVRRSRRRPGAAAASVIVVLTLTSASSLLRTAAAEIVAKAARFVLPNCGCCSAFVPSNLQPAISRFSFVRSRADPVGRCTRSLRALDDIRRRRRRCRPLLPVDTSPPASISSRGRRRRVSGIAEARAAVQQSGYRTSTRRIRRTRLLCSSVGKDPNNILVTGIAAATANTATAAAATSPTATAKDEASARARSTRDVAVSSWKLELGGMALEVRGGGSHWSHAAAVAGDELPPTARVDVAGSSVAVRLRRNQAELKRLRTSGSQDIFFEFSGMREAIPLPCRIQLVPRADRTSLVYVDGKELPRRRAAANAAGGGGSFVMTDSSGAIPPSSFEITPEISRGGRVASVGLAAIAAMASGAGTTRPVTGSTEGGLHENEGCVYAESGNKYLTDDRDEERVLAEGRPSRPSEGFAVDAIKLVGEMEISKPAYLQVQEGGYDRSDALLVTQFGLTRSGALLRIDLDSPPLPTSPPLLPPSPLLLGNAGAEERAVTAAAVAAAVGDEPPRSRARLRLTGTWGDPLVWPNEVNEVPSSAVVRLTRGEEAEACFLAYRRSEDDDGCGGQEIARGRGSLDSIGRQYRARFPHLGRDEFDRLRAESDNFVNRVDGSNPQLGQTAQRNPDPFPRGMEEGSPAGGNKHTQRAEDVPDGGKRAEKPCPPLEWDESLPPRAVLVADGFLVPGKADGGVYVIIPSLSEEGEGGGGFDDDASGGRQDQRCAEGRMVQLTRSKRGWFYHKAVWVELPGRERKVVLTARARKPLFGPAEGELVLLEMPRVNAPLAEQNLPWRETVLAKGPDVMFEVVDLDPTDCTVQVMCAEFFGGRVTMHSLWGGEAKPGSRPSVTESWVLDEDAGPAYSITAADLRGGSPTGRPTHFLVTTHESSYSSSSPGAVAAAWMRENSGLSFEPDRVDADQTEADLLRVGVGGRVGGAMGASSACDLSQRLRSSTQRVEGLFEGSETEESEEKREEVVRWWDVDDAGKNAGGKLLAYEIPEHWRIVPNRPPGPGCCGWRRETLASGFRVRGLSINAGSPGFPYIFHPHKSMEGKRPPYIALAGDCSQAAYILRPAPVPVGSDSGSVSTAAATERGSIDSERTLSGGHGALEAPLVYEVACKIEVPGTVGSLAVGYGSFMGNGRDMVKPSAADPPSRDGSIVDEPSVSQERVVEGGNIDGAAGGWAKLFVPNYDGNKVYVFSMEPHAKQGHTCDLQ